MNETVQSILSEEIPVQVPFEIAESHSALTDADKSLRNAREQLARAKSATPTISPWPLVIGGFAGLMIGLIVGFVGDFYLLGLTFVGTGLSGLLVAVAGGGIGFWVGKSTASSKQEGDVISAQDALEIRERERKNRMTSLQDAIQDERVALQKEWAEQEYTRMWVMPRYSFNPSLPLPGDSGGIDDRFNDRTSMRESLQAMLRYIVSPIANLDIRVRSGTALVAGSQSARDTFGLPEANLRSAFGGDWSIQLGVGDLGDSMPLHYLLFWESEDGKVMPKYYTERPSIRLERLPARFNAWPKPD